METFFEAFASVLSFFYSLVHNYALAITLLTLVVMVVVTPLTLKGTRSMMIMQQLQPEMKKIQQRYKDDRQKLNEELLKFYKENNINPLGGCLPLVVQMPIFIILYQVLRGLTRRVSELGFNVGWSAGQLGIGTTPGKAPSVVRPFDPAFLNPSSEMYRNLHGNTVMASPPFNIDLAESASQAWSKGLGHALPFVVLVVIVGVTGFVQQRQIQGRSPNSQVNPQQQMIMRIMPVFLPLISISLPAGLVLYFAVSNLYRIGQQAFISRSIYGMKRADGSTGGGLKEMILGPQSGSGTQTKTPVRKQESTQRDGAGSKGDGKAQARPAKASTVKGSTEKKTNQASKKGSTPRKGAPSQKGKGSPSAQSGASTLQPRARKNKKR